VQEDLEELYDEPVFSQRRAVDNPLYASRESLAGDGTYEDGDKFGFQDTAGYLDVGDYATPGDGPIVDLADLYMLGLDGEDGLEEEEEGGYLDVGDEHEGGYLDVGDSALPDRGLAEDE